MSTAGDIVDGAFRLCGVRLPTTDERTDALEKLNELLALWSAERLMVYQVTEDSLILVVGQAVYTIGTSGNFNVARPHKIVDGYLRDSSSTDTPLDVILSLHEYNAIADKVSRARPTALYYAQEFPLGKVHFDYPADAAYTFKCFSWKPLSSFADLTTTLVIPAEYIKALRYHLAVDLAPEMSVQLDPTVVGQASAAKLIIQNLNRDAVAPVQFDAHIVRELLR